MFTTNAIIMMVIAVVIIILCISETKEVLFGISISKNNRIDIRLKYLLIMLFFLILGTLISDSYDISAYRYAYVRRISHSKEPLFDIIQFYFHDKGISFETFKFLWFCVTTLFLYRGVKKYTRKPEQVIAFTLFIGLLSFVTQWRSGIAFAIILNYIPLLYSGKNKDRVIYTIIVLFCAMIHIVAITFLIFLLIRRNKRRFFKTKYYLLVFIVSVLMIILNNYFVNILSLIIGFIPGLSLSSTRIIASLRGVGTPIKAAIFLIIKQLILYAMTERACSLSMTYVEQNDKHYDILSEINTLSLIIIPICILNASFTRLFVPIMLIQIGIIVDVGHVKAGLSTNFAFSIRFKSVLVLFAIALFCISMKSNPEDFVRMMNSIQF